MSPHPKNSSYVQHHPWAIHWILLPSFQSASDASDYGGSQRFHRDYLCKALRRTSSCISRDSSANQKSSSLSLPAPVSQTLLFSPRYQPKTAILHKMSVITLLRTASRSTSSCLLRNSHPSGPSPWHQGGLANTSTLAIRSRAFTSTAKRQADTAQAEVSSSGHHEESFEEFTAR